MKKIMLVILSSLLLASCGTNEDSSSEPASSSEPFTVAYRMSVNNVYYDLEKYQAENNTWISTSFYANVNDEVKFKANDEIIPVYSDGATSNNNIKEVHPSNNPFTTVHVKDEGFVTITLKYKSDTNVYTFWIGQPKVYDTTVRVTSNPIHVVGYNNDWAKSNDYKLTATSINEVAKLDRDVADRLSTKSIEYVYIGTYTFSETGPLLDRLLDEDGNLVMVHSGLAFKFIVGEYGWTPSQSFHIESLDNGRTFIPPFVEWNTDPRGFNYETNLVCQSEPGTYKVVFIKYTTESTLTAPGYAVAIVKVNIQ